MANSQKHTNAHADSPTIMLENETTDGLDACSLAEDIEDSNDNTERQAIELVENVEENELAARMDDTKCDQMTMAEKKLKKNNPK